MTFRPWLCPVQYTYFRLSNRIPVKVFYVLRHLLLHGSTPISKIGRERNEPNQDSKTENESEGPFSRWLALVALTSSFCLFHSCWSLFTARFFSCGSDWTELLGTIARLTALAAQPDTTASRTLLPLSIKLLYLALTAHCLLSCRLVRWTRACGFSTFSAWSCDGVYLWAPESIQQRKRLKFLIWGRYGKRRWLLEGKEKAVDYLRPCSQRLSTFSIWYLLSSS